MALKVLEPIKEPWSTHSHLVGLPKKTFPHSVPLLQQNTGRPCHWNLGRSETTCCGWCSEGLTGRMKMATSQGPQKIPAFRQQPCVVPFLFGKVPVYLEGSTRPQSGWWLLALISVISPEAVDIYRFRSVSPIIEMLQGGFKAPSVTEIPGDSTAPGSGAILLPLIW